VEGIAALGQNDWIGDFDLVDFIAKERIWLPVNKRPKLAIWTLG
jgi:hypothetical protein